jgi:predicted RNA-binding protein YlqC (UPF0109 family)
MSAFDDEFGLFGEEQLEENERRSTLGARKIATNETIIDDIEPEDEAPRRRGPIERGGGGRPGYKGGYGKPRRHEKQNREPVDPEASRARASDLLAFLAKKLVAKPDAVLVDHFPPEDGYQAQIELIVDPEDLGKVIGRNGRVAQALRTIVRATAEGKVSVEILDSEEAEQGGEEGDAGLE